MIFGIGTDLVEIERIAKVLARHGDRFTGYILTDGEGATPLCLRLSFPCPGLVPPSRKSPADLSRIQIPHLRHGRSRPFLITGIKKGPPKGPCMTKMRIEPSRP